MNTITIITYFLSKVAVNYSKDLTRVEKISCTPSCDTPCNQLPKQITKTITITTYLLFKMYVHFSKDHRIAEIRSCKPYSDIQDQQ